MFCGVKVILDSHAKYFRVSPSPPIADSTSMAARAYWSSQLSLTDCNIFFIPDVLFSIDWWIP